MRNEDDYDQSFCVMLIVVTWHISEAFATLSFQLPIRGGATRHNVIATLERNGMYLDSNNKDDDNDDDDNDDDKMNIKKLMKNFITTKATVVEELKSNGVQQQPISPSSSSSSSASGATFIADTALPSDLGVNLRLRAYRANVPSENGYIGNEPCVIYSADKPPFGIDDNHWKEHVPIRVHDQCLTSEVFGSRRCDCREQLVYALQYVSKNGGAVIYLQQEGRGIGLANKVAAYALQDQGMDTVDANVHLGFPPDARQYGVIPSILQDLKIQSIRLMTNNPRKTDRLSSLGVQVDDTIPMVVPNVINEYNRRYLETKKRRMNHQNFGDILRQDLLVTTKNRIDDKQVDKDDRTSPFSDISNTITETIAATLSDATSTTTTTTPSLEGVSAQEDGYCFGKQSVLDAIAAIARGDMVCVVDDMDRENEGDLIMAADLCTPQAMATIIRYSSGVICIAMEGNRMDELGLPPMVINNEDPKGTAFSISVDATKEHGMCLC
jgi:GTP cyclohydrolase II